MAKKEKYTRREVISTIGAAVATSAVMSLPVNANAEELSLQNPVTEWRILRYSFGWNAERRTGLVNLYLENVPKPVKIKVASPTEFSGYVTILKEEPVFYNSAGWIHTGTERVE